MKPIIIAGVATAFALGGWFLFKPGAAFDFDSASRNEQQGWLEAQARPMAKSIDRALPKGAEGQPAMKVAAARVNAAKRRIEIDIAIKGPFRFTEDPIAAKRAFGQQFCPGYAQSELGRNDITVIHTFHDAKSRPVLTVGVSPIACRKHMQG